MNKLFLTALLLAFLISNVAAIDIAYIVRNSNSPAQYSSVTNILNQAGRTYELIDDSQIPSTDFSNYEMILISSENLNNYERIPVSQKKTLILSGNSRYLDEWGIADYANCLSSSNYELGEISADNEITQNLANPIQLYNSRNADLCLLPYSYKSRAPGLEKIITD